MPDPQQPRRRGKKLLVAAIGVASVSYVSAQGCVEPQPYTSGNLVTPPGDLSITGDAAQQDALVPSGNLQVPPQPDATTFVSGNLLPPPPDVDATPPTSGNLLPPPPSDAALDAGDATDGRVQDARVFDALPPTAGNLLPPAPRE